LRHFSIVAAAVVLGVSVSARAADAPPTFSKDVAPIFYKNCAECHRPTMFAPMSLLTYEAARPYARSIKTRVAAGTMPPWGADPHFGTFKNDPRLSQKEIDTIVAWVDAGAPKGDDKDLPAAPKFVDGWTIGQPDLVATMDETFHVPAEGVIPYKYFRIPTHIADDRWIQAIEIKPGARSHVHHVIAFTAPVGAPLRPGSELGPTNIGGVTPNKPGIRFDPGTARLLRGNQDIVLQMHYTTNGTEADDKTEVGIIFAKEPPKRIIAGGYVLNFSFTIPPNTDDYEVKSTTKLEKDIMLTSLTPHMHVRGKDMIYIAHYPDGKSETLLSVPKYDFNWQISYQLAEAKRLPKGTEIEVIAHYDNSANNKFNPDPTKAVKWGDQTFEEMMIGFFGTVQDPPAATGAGQKQ